MIDYEVDGDGIATIALNMAERPMNVLNDESAEAIGGAVRKAIADDQVSGVIVTSRKNDFMAGADLTVLLGERDPQVHMGRCRELQQLWREIETGGKPFVAAINGTALGGGFEFCLACHYRVAADAPRSLIGLPEVSIGLLPGSGGTQRLPRMIGIAKALPLLVEGTRHSPAQALEAGIVDAVVPPEELLDAARTWLRDSGNPVKPWDERGYKMPGAQIQSMEGYMVLVPSVAKMREKTRGNYPAPLAIMTCVYEGCQVAIDTGLKIEARQFSHLAAGDVAQNMIRSMFFSMGDANRLKRRPKEFERRTFGRIGVLGAGMMGSGIACAAAGAGLDVVLLETTPELAEQGKAYSAGVFGRNIKRGRMTEADRDAALGRIAPTDDYADLAGCEIVIEAVFEDQDVKADVTGKTEAVIAEDTIFASNTSTLPISGLAGASSRPERFVGMHFFSPAERMTLVEVIRGEKTSDETIAAAMDLTKQLRKTPVLVNDSRGFFTSRVINAYLNEGRALVAEGVNPALIENAATFAGLPVGPLALSDEVSMELQHRILNQTRAAMGDAFKERGGDAVIDTFVEKLDRRGRKAGKGFYEYPDDGDKRLWPGLADVYARAADQPDVEAVKKRLLYIQCVEAARCLEEDVVLGPEDADVASILGWGFPTHLGGVMSMVHTVGIEAFVSECDALAQRLGARFSPPDNLRNLASTGGALYAA
jgi:3-hydroxyacyl-CoA dehydrogenase/enoyl-CoA hydratase/3-hydroxybutyryl-CoA epimerase